LIFFDAFLAAQGINIKKKAKIQLVLANWIAIKTTKTENKQKPIQDGKKQQSTKKKNILSRLKSH